MGTRTPCQCTVVGCGSWLRESDDETVADTDTNERTRQAAVVGPGLDRVAGGGFDSRDASLECHFDDARIGVEIGRFGESRCTLPVHPVRRPHGLVETRGEQ